MKNVVLFLVTIISFVCTNLQAQIYDRNELELKIDSMVPEAVNDTTPGFVLGIVHNGKLIFSKGYGMANLAYGIPNDSKMVYNIGSVSKQFLGFAFAMLHEEGSLNLDDPVNKYLEDWPEFEHKVTLRHLLTHTSGYREAYAMSSLAGRFIGIDRLSRDECLNVVRKQPELEFVPGSRYTYNSTAYVILAEVFEKVKGVSADDWIKKNMLEPLQMNNTQIETYVGEVIENAAESYSLNDEKGFVNEESNRAIFGAAEVYSSVEDLAKWINNYKTAEIGGTAVREIFIDPFVLNNGVNSEYALGIGNNKRRGLRQYSHSGGHEAFLTLLGYYPEADLGYIFISNFGGNGYVQVNEIMEYLLKDQMSSRPDINEKRIKVKANELTQYEGQYLRSTMNRVLELKISSDTLKLNGQELVPIGKSLFGRADSENEYRFEKTNAGNMQLTVISSNGIDLYDRIDSWSPDTDDLKVYEGDYWSDEIETVYHLKREDKKLSIHHRWIGEIGLQPVTKDFFKGKWGIYVKFNRNAQGDVMDLAVFSGRTLNARFKRIE